MGRLLKFIRLLLLTIFAISVSAAAPATARVASLPTPVHHEYAYDVVPTVTTSPECYARGRAIAAKRPGRPAVNAPSWFRGASHRCVTTAHQFVATKPGGVHIDIGGEGRYADAINLNPNTLTSTTGTAGRPIPNLVQGRGEQMPFASGSAARITVENAPIRPGTAGEISRVIRPGGQVVLEHPDAYAPTAVKAVIDATGGRVVSQTTGGGVTRTVIRAG